MTEELREFDPITEDLEFADGQYLLLDDDWRDQCKHLFIFGTSIDDEESTMLPVQEESESGKCNIDKVT